MAKVGVILSGCGVMDGTEIHEAVSVLLHLDRLNTPYQCLAPNIPQMHVVDHLDGSPTEADSRNVLIESARIARGDVKDLAKARGTDYDAWILPGGFGAAKNLSTFAVDGASCTVDPDVARVLREAHQANRPLGFACIAPAIAAAVFGREFAPELTIGEDTHTAERLEQMGARHETCHATDCVIDKTNHIVTTPAYMEAKRIHEVYEGIGRMVEAVAAMLGQPVA